MESKNDELEKQAREYFEKTNEEAEELLKDPDKIEQFLQKVENKLIDLPLAGSSLVYVPLLVSMVRMYIKKEYTEVPLRIIVASVAALLYFVLPTDLIPDFVPVLGYVDDATVIIVLLKYAKKDINDYCKWRKDNGYTIEDAPNYDELKVDSNTFEKAIKLFFNREKK